MRHITIRIEEDNIPINEKIHFYIYNEANGNVLIDGDKYTYLGSLGENNESTFFIGDDSTFIYAITGDKIDLGKASKKVIANGNKDITIIGHAITKKNSDMFSFSVGDDYREESVKVYDRHIDKAKIRKILYIGVPIVLTIIVVIFSFMPSAKYINTGYFGFSIELPGNFTDYTEVIEENVAFYAENNKGTVFITAYCYDNKNDDNKPFKDEKEFLMWLYDMEDDTYINEVDGFTFYVFVHTYDDGDMTETYSFAFLNGEDAFCVDFEYIVNKEDSKVVKNFYKWAETIEFSEYN